MILLCSPFFLFSCLEAEPGSKVLLRSAFRISTPTRATHRSAAPTYSRSHSAERSNRNLLEREKKKETRLNIASFEPSADWGESMRSITNANLHFRTFSRSG